LTRQKVHNALNFFQTLKFIGFSALILLFSVSAYSQNTKGDRPVKNQRQVRETKGKSVKKKGKANTRDVANRRLRTKDKSSANRANAKYPQTSPYVNRSKKPERAASPRGKVFSKSPRESRTQAWKGDVSGYRVRRVKPGRNDAARTNVYPQKGQFVRMQGRPKQDKPATYGRTIKGRKIEKAQPHHQERAWTGGLKNEPIIKQSPTGSARNVYPNNKGPYASYAKKHLTKKEKPVSNRNELGLIRNLSRKPLTGGGPGYGNPASASQPFIKRGKKNVYWGKFSKKEKPFLRDLTGGPLRTRNFKTMPAGLVGTDTVRFFGRKPGGDRANRVGGSGFSSISGNRYRKGDIAGWRLRRSGKGGREVAGKFFFPRKLSISATGRQGKKIPGSGFKTNTKRGEQAQLKSVANIVYDRDLNGKVKRGVKKQIGGDGSYRAARFSGNIPRNKGFSAQGADYSGNIKRSSVRGFSANGVDYSGKIKRSSLRGFSANGVDYSGKIKRNRIAGFSEEHINYSGNIKRSRPDKGGGSVSGRAWNNNNSAIQKKAPISDQGGNFSGNIKFKRPEKGGGSVSGRVWNNNNSAIQKRAPISDQGGNFSGNIKYKRPEKGGGSVSAQSRNNNYKAIAVRPPVSDQGGNYSGNIKYKRPEKGGGSVSGILWNNDNTPIQSRRPLTDDANYSGKIAQSKFKKNYVQNPNASKESIKKHRIDPSAFRVAGLGVKVREGNYKTKPNAAHGSMPGVAPSKSTVKANEYARSMKQYWEYKHNPNSSHEALKVRAPGKANARVGDFQGNVRMHKYSGQGFHPDSQFAHGYRDNVKEERTLLMNVKLVWGKLFRKNETQPDNLKEKNHRPRYDKKEKGLWND
jgi:hypothetical protein